MRFKLHQNYVFSTSSFHIKFSHWLLRSSSTSCTNLNSRHFQNHACSTLRGARVPWRRWPEKKDGCLLYRPPAAQIVVLGHRFFFFGFFLRFLSVLGRECLPCLRWADWIDLPPLHVYRQLCLGLVGRRAAAPGKSAELPACWEKCEGQPGKFPNKSRANSISFRSVAQTTFSLWKKAEWAFFIFPPAFWFPFTSRNDSVIYYYFLFQSRGFWG